MLVPVVNVGSDGQGALLTVSHKQQPDPGDDLKHSVYRQYVQRVVCAISHNYITHQGQPQRVQRSDHHFNLAQWRVVFAVPKLKQVVFPLTRMIAGYRGCIQAHSFQLQFVHPQNVAAQFRRNCLSGGRFAQAPK